MGQKFISTDIQFHSRHQKPTLSLRRALEKAQRKGSAEIRVYGKSEFVLDPETGFVYLRLRFSKEIEKLIEDKVLTVRPDSPWIPDKETELKMKRADKKKLKTSTRVWRKD